MLLSKKKVFDMKNKAEADRIKHHLDQLARFSSTARGVTRLPFSEEARLAADYLSEAMKAVGLNVHIDNTGAVHGIREGRVDKRIVIGSHYDSVPEGGAFDGIAGVVCGIELARLLQNSEMAYGLEVIAFNDEEGVRFGDGFLSSKALLGELSPAEMKTRQDDKGISIYEAASSAGFQPDKMDKDKWNLDDIRAFFEIHVEQGGVLEHEQQPLGLVSGIVGMRRYRIELTGQADHAGTTPMELRHDAMVPAAAVILVAHEAAMSYPRSVATVGSLHVEPDAVNTVASKVVMSLDLRSMEVANMEGMAREIFMALEQSAEKSDIKFEIIPTLASEPGYMDETLKKYLTESTRHMGVNPFPMISGAGHDALPISAKLPTAMLFVPSQNGRSHCPEEWSDCQDLALAVDTLCDTILTMNMEE